MEEETEEAPFVVITNDFWPRWTERSINEIQWSSVEGKKKAPKKSPKTEVIQEKGPPVFTDKEVCILPKNYQEKIYCWKRPNEIFEDATSDGSEKKIEIYSNDDVDLHEANVHLKLSSYYLQIMDAFVVLKMYKSWRPEDLNEFGFTKWSPLNHIYSGSKVQQGVPHEVQVNPYGKYAIRLFHCGQWRQIIVDDRIPTDKANQILMPCIRSEASLQLWPLLITKAILKLNFCRIEDEEFYIDQRHTPECKMYDGDYCNCKVLKPINSEYLHEERDLQRLSVIFALTGWCPLEKGVGGQYASDVWEYNTHILDQYEVKPIVTESKTKKKGTKEKKGAASGKKDKKVENVPQQIIEQPQTPATVRHLVTIALVLPPNLIEKSYKKSFVELLCSQCRDTPLFQAARQEELPLWKTFRWVYWAMEKNIWKPYDPSLYWSILCSLPRSKKTSFEPILEDEWASIVIKKDVKKEIKEPAMAEKPIEEKKAKSNKKKVKERQPVDKKEEPFPLDNWLSFNKILPILQGIKEYYNPQAFEKNFIVSDEIIVEEVSKTSKKKQETPKTGGSKASKKATKDSKTANEDILEEKFKFFLDHSEDLYLFIDDESESEIIIDLSTVNMCPEKKATVTLSSFKWHCEKQRQIWTLCTSNFTNLKMRLSKGRSAYKLQFDASKFCLRVYTNAPLRMGYFDDLIKMMNSESVRMIKYFENIKKSFFGVITSFGQKQFPANVQNFFHSLLEYSDEFHRDIIPFRHYVYNKFIEMILNFLAVLEYSEGILAIKRLFVLADFSHSYDRNLILLGNCKKIMKEYNEIKDCLCDCPNQDEPYFTEETILGIKTCAAVIIQAAMKRYYVKLLKTYHFGTKQKPQEKPKILKDALTKFYEKYFDKEPNLMYDLLRKFLFTTFEDFKYNDILETPIPQERLLGKFYDFFKDFINCHRLLNYPGIVEQSSYWIPLKIGCLYCHSSEPSKYILNISTSAEQKVEFFIKVIRCDDLTEVTPTVAPYLYTLTKEGSSGYKVAVYMYSSQPLQNLKWTLQISFPRHTNYAHFCDLCGVDKCHCPSDTQVSKQLEDYHIKCVPDEMQDFVIFQKEDTLYENYEKLVCQVQIFAGKKTLIFGFIQFSGEPLNLSVMIMRQGTQRIVMNKKFSERIDFYKPLEPGSYTLLVEYYRNTGLAKILERQNKQIEHGEASKDGEDIHSTELEANENEEIEEEVEEEPKELGTWNIKVAYEEGFDVVVN